MVRFPFLKDHFDCSTDCKRAKVEEGRPKLKLDGLNIGCCGGESIKDDIPVSGLSNWVGCHLLRWGGLEIDRSLLVTLS